MRRAFHVYAVLVLMAMLAVAGEPPIDLRARHATEPGVADDADAVVAFRHDD